MEKIMTTDNTTESLETNDDTKKEFLIDTGDTPSDVAVEKIKDAVEGTKPKRGPKPKTKENSDVEANAAITQIQGQVTQLNSQLQDSTQQVLKVFKLNQHTKIPSYGTEASACFDIRVNLQGELDAGNKHITAFTKQNQVIDRKIEVDTDGRAYVELRPYERLITPTGAIFDIPEGYSLKVHPRSGTSLKQGINLINQEAVIDADFVEELKILLVNSSEGYVKIYHDERYAQGELQVVLQTKFEELTERPQQKTDRTGGLGHTGTK